MGTHSTLLKRTDKKKWITRAYASASLVIILSCFAAQAQDSNLADRDRELARSSVTKHLANKNKAPRGGFKPVQGTDVGNIAVIEASTKTGTALPANKFDLNGKSILFKRASDGSYQLQASTSAIGTVTGTNLVIGSAQAKAVKLPFSFPFYHATYKSVFVHANGNLTLGKPALPPFGLTEEELFHVVPRIAPLDVWSLVQSNDVTVSSGSTQATFTWKIAGPTQYQAQAILFKTGDIGFKYQSVPVEALAITGITPGATTVVQQSVDFSQKQLPVVRGAAVETFSPTTSIDQVAIAKAFLSSHPDTFDMLALFFSVKHPGRPSIPSTGVDIIYQNSIKGIGRSQYNFAKVLGTTGRLKAIASMFDFEAYPSDPHQTFPGVPAELGRNPLELTSHEIGHYWLASTRILENGAKTTNLLSDGCCHWSFTFDADGSFMNGNDIQDNSNGTFITKDPLVRFSSLDQYLMGLIPASDVGPMFYVASAGAVRVNDDAKKNVTFSGTRVNVTVDQIIAAEGPRVPAFSSSQHSFRVAFILIVDQGRKPTSKEIQKLEKLRAAWPAYFQSAASNKITMSSTLN